MKLRLIMLCLLCVLLLGGCGWPDGSYHSVTPHQELSANSRTENLVVTNYEELVAAMEDVVSRGTESCIINAVNYEGEDLQLGLINAIRHIQKVYPIGAYAVEDLKVEVGSNTGKTAIALSVSYRHSRTEIRKIRNAENREAAKKLICDALEDYETVLVLQLEDYEQMDFTQIVRDHAMDTPQAVMEIPQVTSEVYGIGHSRVVELTFSYQTSLDSLRTMQAQVQPVFDSAVLYVSGEGSQSQKYSQLYAFLMERFDYTVETSITPAYSLLRHGVGDSRAFATVYAAMCRAAGLDCVVVTGTRSGDPWVWNIICQDDVYYHVDLMRCNENGRFRKLLDEEMMGYVWDYSAYPRCVREESLTEVAVPEDTLPQEIEK
ncbi:MAG: transglutaminase domain-containing protein [Oscillospiraceae bacterium]|nr:transglutaminase domain-containing protein [Oscillospiraceae bacterium]MBQ7130322.1 transglutaminase domain-containing protein [Oscillospiraceae bacterium]